MKIKLAIFSILIVAVATGGAMCKVPDNTTKEATKPIVLNYWRVFDGADAFAELIENYNDQYPYINIAYKKFRYDEYEDELLNAMAEDRGPDIFSIHNTWTKKYKSKLAPSPDFVAMPQRKQVGAIKKEMVTEMVNQKLTTPNDIKKLFVGAVYDDVVLDYKEPNSKYSVKKVFGLPLYVDTLAMYYNRDLLNNAGITEPSSYWNKKFQEDIKKLTKQNTKGRIIQSGVSLGGSDNIDRFSDILAVLMMQNGATMIENGGVKFNKIPPHFAAQSYNPGLEALRFYTDFANPRKEVYCWNDTLDNSTEMFKDGNLAFMFGYSYHGPIIKAQNPKLNFGVVKLPQIEGNQNEVNFANYWVEVVSKKSAHIPQAWHFIWYMSQPENVKLFLNSTKKPTALRSLINEQLEDEDIAVFADQLLTAKSWYSGVDSVSAEAAFGDMIDETVKGERESLLIINDGAAKVQQTVF